MEALKRMLRMKSVPKSVMERMKPLDDKELRVREQNVRRMCRSQLEEGVDWELMKKHLHTPEALQEYEEYCRCIRDLFENNVASLVYKRCPDRYFQNYYGKYPWLPFKERMLRKWTEGKDILVKRVNVIWIFGLGVASSSAGWMLVGNGKEKEN